MTDGAQVKDEMAARAFEELHKLRSFLFREGYVPCDVPACNCGSWHKKQLSLFKDWMAR